VEQEDFQPLKQTPKEKIKKKPADKQTFSSWAEINPACPYASFLADRNRRVQS